MRLHQGSPSYVLLSFEDLQSWRLPNLSGSQFWCLTTFVFFPHCYSFEFPSLYFVCPCPRGVWLHLCYHPALDVSSPFQMQPTRLSPPFLLCLGIGPEEKKQNQTNSILCPNTKKWRGSRVPAMSPAHGPPLLALPIYSICADHWKAKEIRCAWKQCWENILSPFLPCAAEHIRELLWNLIEKETWAKVLPMSCSC